MMDKLYVPAGSEGGVALGEARVATVAEVRNDAKPPSKPSNRANTGSP